MKPLRFLRKVWSTGVVIKEYMPSVVKEVTELTGVTRVFIDKLIAIWKF